MIDYNTLDDSQREGAARARVAQRGSGKGSSPRPPSIPKAEYDKKFDEIFGKKDEEQD